MRENKRKRFERVATRRVQRVIDSIRSLSQCSSKRMYEWDEKQLEKIWAAIEGELQKCKDSYKNAKPDMFQL